MRQVRSIWWDDSGQDMAEYAVLIGFIALGVLVAMRLMGDTISTLFNDLGSSLESAASVEASVESDLGP